MRTNQLTRNTKHNTKKKKKIPIIVSRWECDAKDTEMKSYKKHTIADIDLGWWEIGENSIHPIRFPNFHATQYSKS